MSTFVPRWARWSQQADPSPGVGEAKTPNQRTCKTSKSPFAGFAGCETGPSRGTASLLGEPSWDLEGGSSPVAGCESGLAEMALVSVPAAETPDQRTCKTSKSPFAGFAGCETGLVGEHNAACGQPSGGVEAARIPFAGFAGCETEPFGDETTPASQALEAGGDSEEPFAGFAGCETSPSEMPTAFPEGRKTSGQRTSKTSKRSSADQVAAMTLDEFASAGLKVRVHSKVLGCDVVFVSDNVPDNEIDARGLPVYRAHELRKLALMKPQPHSLRCIHEVKTVFGGTVEAVTDRESSR